MSKLGVLEETKAGISMRKTPTVIMPLNEDERFSGPSSGCILIERFAQFSDDGFTSSGNVRIIHFACGVMGDETYRVAAEHGT